MTHPDGTEVFVARVDQRARRLLVLGTYREEAATAELAGLVERLDPSGAAHRRLGPFDREEVTEVLSLYGTAPAAQAAAGTVLERTGGLPLLVHQTARDWAHTAAERQVARTRRSSSTAQVHSGRLRTSHTTPA